MKSNDIEVIRTYNYRGIRITLRINYLKKVVSIVEWDRVLKEFVPKKFIFAERELNYMGGWQLVYEALKVVTEEATKELEAVKDKEMEDLIESLLNFNKLK